MLNAKQLIRYEKHIDLPFFGEEKQHALSTKKVGLVGAGGLGCPTALYLAASGLGQLDIYDDDTVSLSNLQRQILYTDQDLKSRKVEIVQKRLNEVNEFCNINAHSEKITEANIEHLAADDLIIDTTDNFAVRYLLNEYCYAKKIPLLTGSVLHFNGQIALFNSKYKGRGAACYACMYPTQPNPGEVPSCADSAVLSPLTGLVGTIMAIEALKELLDIGDGLGEELLLVNAFNMTFSKVKIAHNSLCPVCGNRKPE